MTHFRIRFTLLVALAWSGSRLIAAESSDSQLPHGSVGIGTYATISQFKNLQVTSNGQTLLQKITF